MSFIYPVSVRPFYSGRRDKVIEKYRHWLKAGNRSSGTIRLRVHYVGRLARVEDLATVTASELLHWISEPDWSPQTRKSARASMVSFFGWAQDWGRRADNPAAKLPRVIVPRSVPKPAPGVILSRALESASDRDRIMLMLAAYAGLRRAEIARLRWSDLDHESGSIRVIGKGDHGRLVPMLPDLETVLAVERVRRSRGGLGTGWRTAVDPESAFVLPGARGGHIHVDTVGAVLTRVLGEGWTGHTLRHRFATRAYAGTKDLRAVQELLGHSKPETTAQYVAVASDALVAAVLAAAA